MITHVNLTKLVGLMNLDIIVSKKGSVIPKEIADLEGIRVTQLCVILDFDGKLAWAERGKPLSVTVLPIVSIVGNVDSKLIHRTRYETAEDGQLGIVMDPNAIITLNGAEDLGDIELIGHIRFYGVPDYMRDYITFEKLHLVYDMYQGHIQGIKTQSDILKAVENKIDALRREASESIKKLMDENERIKANSAENFALEVGVKIDEVVTDLSLNFKDAFERVGINFEPTTTVEDVVKEPEPEPTKKKSDGDGTPKVTKKISANLVEIPTTFTNIKDFFEFISQNYGDAKLNCVINIYYADILNDKNKVEGGIKKIYYSRKYLKKEFGRDYYEQIVATMSNIHVLAANEEDNHAQNKTTSDSISAAIPNTTTTKETKQKSSGNVLRVQGGYQCFGRTFTPKQAKLILAAEGSKDISERAKIAKGFNEDKIYNKYLNAFKEFVRGGESI